MNEPPGSSRRSPHRLPQPFRSLDALWHPDCSSSVPALFGRSNREDTFGNAEQMSGATMAEPLSRITNGRNLQGSDPLPPSATQGKRMPLGEFAQRVVVAVLLILLILILVYLLGRAVQVLLEAFAGILFAIFLTALSNGLKQRTGMSHGWALGTVVIALVGGTVGAGWLLANQVTLQISELTQKLPQSIEHVQAYLQQFTWGSYLVEELSRAREGFGLKDGLTGLRAPLAGLPAPWPAPSSSSSSASSVPRKGKSTEAASCTLSRSSSASAWQSRWTCWSSTSAPGWAGN